MNKIYKILLVFFFMLSSYPSFSWDSVAAKFYPLAVGNQWSYRYQGYSQFSCVPSPFDTYNFIVKIDSLVSRPNGKWYYKFSDGNLKRIDSSSMNVYTYNLNGDCLVDSLLARKNDTIRECSNNRPKVTDTTHVTFSGVDRRKLRIQVMVPGIFYYELAEGLGLYYRISCEGGGYHYTLNGCVINGVQYGQMLGVTQIGLQTPRQFSLSQNYPNPFNPITNIRFKIPKSGFVKLTIYDVLGKEIQILVNEQLSPGTYNADFVASALPSGVYYYKLEAGEFTETKKMVLIK